MFNEIKNLKLLVFSPSFFNYEIEIKNKLQEMGARVVFFDERPSNSTYGKTILRISQKLSKRMVTNYYEKICEEIHGNSFDQILFFQAEATPRWFLEYLEKEHTNSRKILYLWDSVSDKPNSLNNIDLYDQVYSFDPQDSKMYNLEFRPLFFIDKYRSGEMGDNKKYRYDFSFIGTVRKDRFEILQKLKRNATKKNQSYFIFYYLQSQLMYFYFKYVKKYFRNSNINDFSFKPKTHDEINSIISQSRVLIDIQKPKQVGLTIRTFELIASQKKFVTTNDEIQKYNFYSDRNIELLSRENPIISSEIINSNYKKIEPSILEQYSISYFLQEILGIVKSGNYYEG